MFIHESTHGKVKPDYTEFTQQAAMLRANLYQFLAGAYLNAPSKEFIDQCMDRDFIALIDLIFGKDIAAPLNNIIESYHGRESLDELQQEYMDLFIVPTGRYVTPFEDVYRGLRMDGSQERGPLLGGRAVRVKGFYRSAGADMEKTCKELPTHIGVELSFMSFLCFQELDSSNDNTEDNDEGISISNKFQLWQLKFLQEHITDWFPQLYRSIQLNSRQSFYNNLAQFTQGFLMQDKTHLQEQLEFDLLKQSTTEMESESE